MSAFEDTHSYNSASGLWEPKPLKRALDVNQLIGFGAGGATVPGLLGTLWDGSSDKSALGGEGGASDGDRGFLSLWLTVDGGATTNRRILRGGSSKFTFILGTDDFFGFQLFDTGGSLSLDGTASTFTDPDAGVWKHLAFSWISGSRAQIYLDGSDLSNISQNNLDTLDYTDSDVGFGSKADLTDPWFGGFSEVWSSFTESFDLSTSEIEKFRSTSGLPVGLGMDGSLPGGSQPFNYFPKGDPSDNKGTAGNYTVTGTLVEVAGPGA